MSSARIIQHLQLAVTCALIGGCGPKPSLPSSADCPSVPGRIHDRTRPVVVALCDEVNPLRARSPRNDSEWILFRHVYEGLVDVDCNGDLFPRLAESWSSSDDQRHWTLLLREDQQFADGTPLTAAAVLESWRVARKHGRKLAHRRWMWEDLPLKHVTADGLTLTLQLNTPDPDFPFRLARPEFFVMRPGAGNWPVGTRDRVVQVRESEGVQEIMFDAGPTSAPVTFRVMPGVDPRDAFTGDVHVSYSRNRDALRYLAAQPDLRLVPLPWTRRYVLTDATGSFAWLGDEWPELPRELARDVVSSIARAPREPGQTSSAPDTSAAAFAVRFPRGDPDGEALGARITSLVNQREGSERWIAVAAPPASLFGGEAPAVIPLSRSLFEAARGAANPTLPLTGDRHPLVETRAHFICREQVAGIRFDWDGVPRFDEVGWTQEPSP